MTMSRAASLAGSGIRAAAAAFVGMAIAAPGQAQDPAPAFAAPNLTASGVRAMAAGCAMCHGDEGRPVAGSTVESLAGKRAGEISDAMKAFRDGRREATVMRQIAKGYGDAEIAALADYFASRSK